MSKYKYNKVEHINDVDFTGETEYFEIRTPCVNNIDIRRILPRYTDDLINEGLLYTREEKPWYENIPEHGVLCRVKDYGVVVITEWDKDLKDVGDIFNYYNMCDVTPLTNEEIKKFLRD